MFGSKSREIRDLTRALRLRTAQRDAAWADLREAHHGTRTAAQDTAERLARALRACARYRTEIGTQARVTRRLADSLLDATGNRGQYLLPEERTVLGIAKGAAK